MRHILARSQRTVLERLSRSKVLLGFDFDGTLAPIVDSPDRAALPALTRDLLREVASAYPCAVISGRSRADVARRVAGVGLHAVVGNHGLEPGSCLRRRPVASRWVPRLLRDLGRFGGLWIEDKGLSIAVHFRECRDKSRVRRAISASVAALGPVRQVAGKEVVNLLPPGAANKGLALRAVLARVGCRRAMYVGDEDTDEDVFALDQGVWLLGVRVGRHRGSAARYYVKDPQEVAELLRRLRDLRGTSSRSALAGDPP